MIGRKKAKQRNEMYLPELSKPRPKRLRNQRKRPILQQPFPIPIESLTSIRADNAIWRWYHGQFKSDKKIVRIGDSEEVQTIKSMGHFGQEHLANVEETEEESIVFEDSDPKVTVVQGQDKNGATNTDQNDDSLLDDKKSEGSVSKKRKVFDEDDDTVLELSFSEAFFLSYGLGCLIVQDEEKELNLDQMWKKYVNADPSFPFVYAVYHYFRVKGWVVKPGPTFGSDFLLYKHGPEFFHASYSVRVEVVDKHTLKKLKISGLSSPLTWTAMAGLNRVTEAAAKELMIAEVTTQVNEGDLESPKCLKNLSVREILVRRWIPAQEREQTSGEGK